MVPMTSVEVLADILRFAKDLTPLLTEKNLDKVIAGLAEAREIVARHKKIQEEIVAADAKISEAQKLNEQIATKQAELVADAESISQTRTYLSQLEKDLTEKHTHADKAQEKLNGLIASNESKQAELNAELAKAKANVEETESAKVAIQTKLAKLSEVA